MASLIKPSWLFNQSAVIPYRVVDGQIEILLITSRKRKRWIIPKGVIEPELTPAESAAKEALEEAGITGTVIEREIGRYTYDKWDGTCRVQVYAMRVERILDSWEEQSFRQRRWCSVEEAVAAVSEPPLKTILTMLPAMIDLQATESGLDIRKKYG